MNAITTFTAAVLGFPSRRKPPNPLPGESLTQYVIRNHPTEWTNFVNALEYNFDIPKKVRKRLRNGRFNDADLGLLGPKVEELLEEFANDRLPYHARTLKCLANLRQQLNNPRYGLVLDDVLFPREQKPNDPDEDISFEQSVSELGVKVIWIAPNIHPIGNLATIQTFVHTDFLWLVPGGTRFMPARVIPNLQRVFRYFAVSPKRAFYTDNADSVILRTAALHALARRGDELPANARDLARMLQEAGYEWVADNDPDSILCELETQYGGRGLAG